MESQLLKISDKMENINAMSEEFGSLIQSAILYNINEKLKEVFKDLRQIIEGK